MPKSKSHIVVRVKEGLVLPMERPSNHRFFPAGKDVKVRNTPFIRRRMDEGALVEAIPASKASKASKSKKSE